MPTFFLRAALLPVVVSTLIFCAVAPAAPPRYRIECSVENTHIDFVGIGRPFASKIRGEVDPERTDAIQGTLNIEGLEIQGEFRVLTDSLKTGIGLRDRHMKEKYLETGKYPRASFKLPKLMLPHAFLEGDFTADAEPFRGNLTLRDIENNVQGTVSITREDNSLQLRFTLPLKITEFKIAIPKFMGISMEDVVALTVQVKSELKKLL